MCTSSLLEMWTVNDEDELHLFLAVVWALLCWDEAVREVEAAFSHERLSLDARRTRSIARGTDTYGRGQDSQLTDATR